MQLTKQMAGRTSSKQRGLARESFSPAGPDWLENQSCQSLNSLPTEIDRESAHECLRGVRLERHLSNNHYLFHGPLRISEASVVEIDTGVAWSSTPYSLMDARMEEQLDCTASAILNV